MQATDHRYEVMQIIAEGRERQIPLLTTLMLVAHWFDINEIPPPLSLVAWLAGQDVEEDTNGN